MAKGSSHSAQPSPEATRLPLESRTGVLPSWPSMRTLKVDITSGRSGQKVILRKPWASHWVQYMPRDM